MTLDPDPLHVDDERIPSSKPYRLVPDSPRRGCSILPWLVLAVLVILALAAPRPTLNPATPASAFGATPNRPAGDVKVRRGPEWTGAPQRLGTVATAVGHAPLVVSDRPDDGSDYGLTGGAPQPAVASAAIPTPAQDASSVTWEGTLAYALPSYGPRYLAIRQPRGSRVVVCGPAACLTRISTDFGPTLEMARQGRIADVSAVDFPVLCGVPLSFGLCPGTLTLAGLPETDARP